MPALLSTFETVMFSRLGGRPVELIYVPALRWAYAWPAGPVQMDYVVARIRERGWHVDRVGSARGFVGAPIVPPRAAAR